MARFWKVYDGLETAIALAMLSVCVLTVLLAAIGRTIGSPVQSAPQFALLFLIWTVMLGADICLKQGEHIRVSALSDILPHNLRKGLVAINLVLIVPFLCFLAWHGFQLAAGNWQRELGASGLSYGLVTLALPVGALLFLVSLGRRFATHGLDATLEPADHHRRSPL